MQLKFLTLDKFGCFCKPGIVWTSERGEESFYDLISDDDNVVDMMSQLANVVQGKGSYSYVTQCVLQ